VFNKAESVERQHLNDKAMFHHSKNAGNS
jgi:hypothetical protein